MTAAPLTRRPTVSVRLLGLADRRARCAAYGGPDRSCDDGSGDGPGCSSLLDGLATGRGGQGGDGDEEGDGGAFHGKSFQ